MLCSSLKADKERFIQVTKDQYLLTRSSRLHPLRNGEDSKCWYLSTLSEDHLISGCSIITLNEITEQSNVFSERCAKIINYPIHKQNMSKSGTNSKNCRCDFVLGLRHTSYRTIQGDRPDITIKNFNEQKCCLMDVIISADKRIKNSVNVKKKIR